MPCKRRITKFRRADATEAEWQMMMDEVNPRNIPGWEGYFLTYNQAPGSLAVPSLGDIWLQHCDAILADWAPANPGRRLGCWWKFSAPRWEEFDSVLAEPRRMVGGVGMPIHRRSDNHRHDLLHYEFGIPTLWEDAPHDPAKPALFESQAAYLDRHGLFLPGERKRLKAADFEPEAAVFK